MHRIQKNISYWFVIMAIGTVFCYLLLFYTLPTRQHIFSIFSLLIFLFAGYFYALRELLNHSLKNSILLKFALALRLLPLLSIPLLSDDFYRFLWDGQLLAHHFNPFAHLPIQLMERSLEWLDPFLYKKMNSPLYYSVYPPVNQFVFWLSALAGKGNLLLSLVILRLCIVAFDMGNLFLIKKILALKNLNPNLLYVYALNPLVIIEFAWNLHFEAAMIFFTLLSVCFFLKNQNNWSAISLAMAVCSKLIPVIFIPLLIKQLGWLKTLKYSFIVGMVTVLLFFPFISNLQLLHHLLTSLKLYHGSFEFNGSFYLLLKYFGWQYFGYNPIFFTSKLLLLITLSSFILIYIKSKNIIEGIFLLLFFYSVFSPVVHPWYVLPLVALSPFVRWRFGLVWSALIGLSYYTYRVFPYQESMVLVIIEYVLLFGFAIWEIKGSNISIKKG